ncbi:MAG: tetratricopeptide repeat protein [Theionarchaea archaeon]|nr:tetratricopeptide repeat protein [Theionarchaea archaeon]
MNEENLFKKGKEHYKNGKYDESLKAFNEAIKTEKGQKNDGIWNWRGRALFKLQRYVEALENYEEAVKLNPKNFYAWYNKGTALLKLKRYEEAHESFKKASETEKGKEKPIVYNYKGYALLKLERYENALIDFEKAIRLLESPEETTDFRPKEKSGEYFYVLYNKGFTLLKLGRYLEALKVFNRAMNLEEEKEIIQENITMEETKNSKSNIRLDDRPNNKTPNIPPAALERTINNIAFAYMRLGIYEKAKKTLDDAIEKNPESISHHVSLGEFFLDHGDLGNAQEEVKKALDNAQEEVKKALDNAQEEVKKALDNAQEEVKKALGIDALFSKLKSEIKEKNCDKAIKLIDKYLKTKKEQSKNEKIDTLILEGKIKIEEKKYDEAIESFEEAIRSGLGDSRPLFWATYAKYLRAETSPYRKGRNNREMIEITSNLERAAYLSKRDGKKGERLHILYSLGFLYYKRKDFSTAKERLKECVSLNLKSPTESKARELLDYIWNYKIKPPWWRWWLFSPLNSLRKRIVFLFLSMIIFLIIVFHLFASELLIFVAGVWKFCIIIEYLQGFRSWQVSVAIIVLCVFFLIWPNVERIWIRDIGIEMSSPPSFEPDFLDIRYPPLLGEDPES